MTNSAIKTRIIKLHNGERFDQIGRSLDLPTLRKSIANYLLEEEHYGGYLDLTFLS